MKEEKKKLDLVHSVLKFVDHERYKVLGVVIALTFVLIMASCGITIRSPITGAKVDRTQFAAELIDAEATITERKAQAEALIVSINEDVKAHNAKAELGEQQFEKKEAFQKTIFETVGGLATTIATGGAINITDIIATTVTLASVGGLGGAALDSVRKNKKIKTLKG